MGAFFFINSPLTLGGVAWGAWKEPIKSHYEYKAIPAPHDSEATSASQTPEARLADAVTVRLNAMAKEGWTYLRSDAFTLTGVAGKQAVLVFRRESDFGMFGQDKPSFGTFGPEAAE